ncbi:MAG: hypothetical protein ACI8RO_000577 [Flavobacteriales bacterium]|jgi:hypothetical protein
MARAYARLLSSRTGQKHTLSEINQMAKDFENMGIVLGDGEESLLAEINAQIHTQSGGGSLYNPRGIRAVAFMCGELQSAA